MMATTASQCIVLNKKNEREYSFPVYSPRAMPKDTRCINPPKDTETPDGLPSSLKMPYYREMADELLLGLFCDAQELCFPDFELLDDDWGCQLKKPEESTDGWSYMELVNINGKPRLSKNYFES